VTQEGNTPHGFLLVNKPVGISSHRCVAQIKRAIGREHKVGHAGTLDPFASGLLIVGVGRAYTKQLPTAMAYPKEYVAQGQLNLLTDTLDPEGEILHQGDRQTTQEQLESAIASLGKEYEQIPPIYSALKFKGKPLYKIARRNKLAPEELEDIVAQKKRLMQLYNMELLSFDFPYFTIKALVSQGTYIRSLVNDIAIKCGTHATTMNLVRTRIGPFTLDEAAECATIANHWLAKGSWQDASFFRKTLPKQGNK